MRKILCFSAIALAVLLIAGCTPAPTQFMDPGMMTANAGGASFTASSCYETFVEGKTEDYVIKGTGTDGVSFIIIDIKRPNLMIGDVYVDTNSGDNSAVYISHDIAYNTRYAQSGTVSIATDSAGVAISGTFNFTTTDGTKVTGGSFRAVFHN